MAHGASDLTAVQENNLEPTDGRDFGEIIVSGERNEIRLPLFEGPLELLISLIRKQEIDIYDIPISLIAGQYLEYLQAMRELNLNVAGEFLEMAATLILIKSRMLLPPDPKEESDAEAEDYEDPRRELVEKLLEYERFQEAAQDLYTRQEVESGTWSVSRMKEVIPNEEELVSVSIMDLLSSFRSILRRLEDRRIVELEREAITVAEKIEQIREILKTRKTIRFSSFLRPGISRLHVVVFFIAMLELTRMKFVLLRQEGFGEDILIIRRHKAA